MNFNLAYAYEILPILLVGARITALATFGGMGLALIIGLIVALGRLSRIVMVSRICSGYVFVIRNTPLLIQLFFLFYVLPEYGILLSPFMTGLAALGLHYGSYTSEVYRAGIQSIPRGQWEAAAVLGFSRWHIWLRIVLPQAIRPIVPVLGNYLIAMFKDTPYLAFITVPELLGAALREAGNTFRYIEPITLVGATFFALSYPSGLAIRYLERRLSASGRK